MNTFKKIYCRVFQTVFKVALPILPYREPEIMHSVGESVLLMKDKGAKSVLVVTDASIRKLGLTKDLEEGLKEAGIRCTVYDEVVPNPTIDNVESAVKLFKENRCQAIFALGGGSAMDCAKGMWLFCSTKERLPRGSMNLGSSMSLTSSIVILLSKFIFDY